MKRFFIFTIALLVALFSKGQKRSHPLPFIIQGQITNCPENYLKIFFYDKNEVMSIDTLRLDGTGHFYLKTYKVVKPHRTSIQQNNIQIKNLFVAPGYNLTITGNGQDFMSLFTSKKISGIGAESNKYLFALDSIMFANNDRIDMDKINENDLLSFINKDEHLKINLAHQIFDKKPVRDQYLSYFRTMTRYDIQFYKLNLLLAFINRNKYDYAKSVSFVRKNFDHNILDNLFEDKYFISLDYRSAVGNMYLNYLIHINKLKDPGIQNNLAYQLETVNKVYKGKIRAFEMYNLMDYAIFFQCKSFENMYQYRNLFQPYFSCFKNSNYMSLIKNQFTNKEDELIRTQIGKPAPRFTLESNLNKTYSLDDFKGKVVYIDLWASWCSPCRAGIPDFRKLVNKFKDNPNIAFLSIAVNDGINEWKKALAEDKPDWIQLLDKENVVSKSYAAAPIPKYILIDKQGNILDFNAPPPGSGEKIEKLLLNEIAR